MRVEIHLYSQSAPVARFGEGCRPARMRKGELDWWKAALAAGRTETGE